MKGESIFRVYYEDTDAGGIVYHANYLRFMERGRAEWLRSLGLDQNILKTDYSILFVVVKSEIYYKSPARLDDQIKVFTEVKQLKRASVIFAQRIENSLVELCMANNVVACVDSKSLVPKRIPDQLLGIFTNGD
ncbi:MAG: tol-pal system-associated acyl-CoA thioesterase [Proteobacteria bacterium]|jgi:acyl-CoA thioester hydrolase|nr:tol-pal system-associated acyl-CoA thioesterase [Pseudomonadota bacterium]MBT5065772.1 tol-pal system-associated acyl-CoA thioesterase [Pseudomonadota bacterium]MBT6192773.1 tol-pal system-associated acyl-CoA thioesterase [Pseudomonadota bacterium]MBT6464995.1 tol-pal system-associated acyl-CoA thioesterase [Pseudomonadota bacterium]MBT6674224.1 tol-pal system-associated acyl-CoA thioesterase [Pseudomonadota bacterium]